MVQEREAAGFAAQRALAEAGEPNRVVVGLWIEFRHHAEALGDAEVVHEVHYPLAVLFYRSEAFHRESAHHLSNLEQTAGEEPLREVVRGGEQMEILCRNRLHHLLKLRQIMRPGDFGARVRVGDHKVSEAEMLTYIFFQFIGQSLGGFLKETDSERFGHFSDALLRRLHQEGHLGIVLADVLAKIHTGVQLFIL